MTCAYAPASPDEPTGTLVLRLSKPAHDVNVSINGRLVVEDTHTQRFVVSLIGSLVSIVVYSLLR